MELKNNTPEKDSLESIELHGSLGYPEDPRVAEYFRLTPDGDVSPNFANIAKHFNAANNLRVLSEVANRGIHRPPLLSTDKPMYTKEAASGATEDVDVGETPDYQKISEQDIKDLEEDPANREVVELLRKNPVKSRKFEEYINNESVNEDPALTATHAMLSDIMGMAPVRETKSDGRSVITHSPAPTHQMIHELTGLMDEELEDSNDKARGKLVEGLNRAMNIFVMQKGVKKNLAHESAEDLLQDFATFLYDHDEFRKMLGYYRKAGNHRFVDEEGKPSPKKPDRNNRYLWVGVPHGDEYFSNQAVEDMANLRADFDKFMAENSDPSVPSKKIRIEVLEPSHAANINPVQGAMAGVVMKIAGKTYHFDKSLTSAPKASAETEEVDEALVKTANESLKNQASSFANKYNSKEVFTSRGPTKKAFGEMLLAWFTKVFIEHGKVPAAGDFDVATYAKFKEAFGEKTGDHTSEQKANSDMVEKWYDSGSTRVPFELKDELPWLFNETTNPLLRLASKVADRVDDLAYDALSRSGSAVKTFTESLARNLGTFLSRVATEEMPSNLNNWIEGVKYERDTSVQNLGKKVEELFKTMLSHPSLSVPGESIWLALLHDHKKEGDHSVLSTYLKKWGDFLNSDQIGLEKQGVQFMERPGDFADDLAERIISPSLSNEATDGQILSYMIKALKGLTGDANFQIPVIRDGSSVTTAKEKATLNRDEPYLNVVYLSGEKPTNDKNRKGITLQAGNAYDLVYGPGSTKENKASGAMEDKDNASDSRNVKFSGYILQVEDGRRVIDLDEARLSTEEIPKFLEFAANNYAARFLDNKEKSMSSTGTDEEKLREVLENQDSDLYQEELDSRQDPIWEYQLANLLKGKSLSQVQEILKKVNKNKNNNLALALNRQFNSKIEKDVNGGYKAKPSLAQEVLDTNPNSEYRDLTEERVGEVKKSLAGDRKSLKDMKLEEANSQKELLDMVLSSKELAEKFIETTLNTDATLASKKNGTLNSLHGMIMDSNYDNALKEVLLENGLSSLMDDLGKGNISKVKTGHRWSDLNDMVTKANAEQSKVAPKAYSDMWEKARSSDQAAFDKIFVPSQGLSVKSQLNDGELRDFLEMMSGDDITGNDQFQNVMEMTATSGGNYSVRDTTADGQKVNIVMLKALVKLLSDLYPHEVRDSLEAHGAAEDFISKDKKEGQTTKYRLRTDAKVSDFKEFMVNHNKPGQLGNMLDPTGGGGAALGSGASRYRIRAPRGEVNKDQGSQTGLTRSAIHKHLDTLLDSFKDRLEVSPDAARLMTEGKGVAKALQGSKALTHSQRNINDITAEVKKVLKHSDTVLKDMRKKQSEAVSGDRNRVDYSDVNTRITKKKKDLISWLHRAASDDIAFDIDTQKSILKIINQLVSSLANGGPITDQYLNLEDNKEALKALAKVEPKRAR